MADPRIPTQPGPAADLSRSGSATSATNSSHQVLARSTSVHSHHQRAHGASVDGQGDLHAASAHRVTRRSASAERAAWVSSTQAAVRARDRERFVPLPLSGPSPAHIQEEDELGAASALEPLDTYNPLLGRLGSFTAPTQQGRVVALLAAQSFTRHQAATILQDAYPGGSICPYPEALHLTACFDPRDTTAADVFVFDYGVLVCWGLTDKQEAYVLQLLAPCKEGSVKDADSAREVMAVHYSADRPPNIQNDTITLSWLDGRDPLIKMAISHALAQSCKLNTYEADVARLVEQVRHLPESLAVHGEVHLTQQQMARIKGRVFIQKSQVNLLSTVMDTPDFFWSQPDALRALYDKICEYCELPARVELVNARIVLIQSMLQVWGKHHQSTHMTRLENVVVLLILLEVVMAGLQVIGFLLLPRNRNAAP